MKKYIITDLAKGNATITADQVLEIGGENGGGTTGDYIPLSGTEVGKPVTRLIEFDEDYGIGFNQIVENEKMENSISFFSDEGLRMQSFLYDNLTDKNILNTSAINIAPSNISITAEYENINAGFVLTKNDIYFSSNNPLCKGIRGQEYYGANYTDNTYIQKLYADKQHSYFLTEYKTGGKWIDDKDIYKITQLTSDPAPTVDTMIKSTVVGGTYTEYEYTKP